MEHFCQPVEGGIGVAAAEAFDEGAGGVVVLVAGGVVEDGFGLDAFFCDGEGDDSSPSGVGGCGECGELEGVEALSGIAVGYGGEVAPGVWGDGDVEVGEAALGIAEGAVNE